MVDDWLAKDWGEEGGEITNNKCFPYKLDAYRFSFQRMCPT